MVDFLSGLTSVLNVYFSVFHIFNAPLGLSDILLWIIIFEFHIDNSFNFSLFAFSSHRTKFPS